MALMPRIRALFRRPLAATAVGARRTQPPDHRRGETVLEDALRTMLLDDPNDVRAFDALADLVRRRAVASANPEDPLTAPADDETAAEQRQRAEETAVWALAAELAGHPRAWYPLIELGRLSLASDPEGAVRRLATAADRDPAGDALAAGLEILRDAGLPGEALSLGIGHWRSREHDSAVGGQMVLAALEAGRPDEAKQHLATLDSHPDTGAVARLRPALDKAIAEYAASQQAAP
jgi:hypothetical protein